MQGKKMQFGGKLNFNMNGQDIAPKEKMTHCIEIITKLGDGRVEVAGEQSSKK